MRTWLDAILGRLFDDGDELEILGGLNFIGFTINRDDANNRYDITAEADASPEFDNISFSAGNDPVSATGSIRFKSAAGSAITSRDGSGNELNFLYIDTATFFMGDGNFLTAFNWNVKSSGEHRFSVASSPVATIDADGLHVDKINDAAPLAPVEGTVLADANANIVATDGSQIRIPTLTANRTYDINNTNAIDEEVIVLYRTGTEAFTATIRDAADATIATFPASTKLAGTFRKATGANFVFVGFQRIG